MKLSIYHLWVSTMDGCIIWVKYTKDNKCVIENDFGGIVDKMVKLML